MPAAEPRANRPNLRQSPTMEREARTKLRTCLRALGLATAFALAAGTLVAGSISWLKDARLGRPTLAFNYSRMMGKWLPALAAAAR